MSSGRGGETLLVGEIITDENRNGSAKGRFGHECLDGVALVAAWREKFDHHRALLQMQAAGVSDMNGDLAREPGNYRLVVTDRNRPVAELGPPPSTGDELDRLIAEGRVSRPRRRGLPEPLPMTGDPHALSRALDEIRGNH